VFGISFGELMLIATVALLVVGPQKLPQMLRSVGTWIARLRRVMTDVRSQSGIDDILRSEGLDGGLNELRSIMKGAGGSLPLAARAFQATANATGSTPGRRVESFSEDRSREYPVEGPDAYGALPEDLLPKTPKANRPEDPMLLPTPPAAVQTAALEASIDHETSVDDAWPEPPPRERLGEAAAAAQPGESPASGAALPREASSGQGRAL
jgi:sec-independent protein translocase protein TatB